MIAWVLSGGPVLRRESWWGSTCFHDKVLQVTQPNMQLSCSPWERDYLQGPCSLLTWLSQSVHILAALVLDFWKERRVCKVHKSVGFGTPQRHFPEAAIRELSFGFTFCWKAPVNVLEDVCSKCYPHPQTLLSAKLCYTVLHIGNTGPTFKFNSQRIKLWNKWKVPRRKGLLRTGLI